MSGARMAVYVLLLLVFLVMVDWGLHRTGGTSAQDASLVYCLAPAHLDGLVTAAVSLGLAGPGSSAATLVAGGRKLSLAQWRATDAGDFRRACDAYAAANMPAQQQAGSQGSPIGAVLDVLLPVIAGALLTMAADDFKQAADRRWALAEELGADWRAFDDAARSFVNDSVRVPARGRPSSGDLDAKRRVFAATLRKVRSLHRRSSTLKKLEREFTVGLLGPSLTRGWDGFAEGKADPTEWANKITSSLDGYGTSLEQVVGAMERRIWLSSKK